MANILWTLCMFVFRTSVSCDIIKWSPFLHLNRMNELMKCHSNEEFIYFLRFSFAMKCNCNFSNFILRFYFFFFFSFSFGAVSTARHCCQFKSSIYYWKIQINFYANSKKFPFQFPTIWYNLINGIISLLGSSRF